jgi:uncharacterized membrane protein
LQLSEETSRQSRVTSPQYNGPSGGVQILHLPLFVLFLLVWLAVEGLMLCLGLPLPDNLRWAEGLFLASATATTLAAMARQLPVQNAVTAALLIGFIASVVQAVGASTGIPFGAYTCTDKFGPRLFDNLHLCVPFLWIVAIVNSRGVARLMLRPWRKTKLYGFRVIGLTCLLTVLFDFGLEPFAADVNRFWIWQTPQSVPAWYTAPWVNFLGWAMTTLLILAFATPWFINKSSVGRPPDYHPFIVWMLLNLVFVTGHAGHQLWWAAGFGVLTGLIVTIFALRGARW